MSQKKWKGPTGYFEHDKEFILRSEHRAELQAYLRQHPKTDEFIQEIELGIKEALGFYKLRQETLPKAVASDLDAILSTAEKLISSLYTLNIAGRLHVSNQMEWEKLLTNMNNICVVLHSAYCEAQQQCRPGRLNEQHKTLLSLNVANAIKNILDITPTTTRTDGKPEKAGELPIDLFALCLRTALNAAGFILSDDTDLYSRMKAGLQSQKNMRSHGGLTELDL